MTDDDVLRKVLVPLEAPGLLTEGSENENPDNIWRQNGNSNDVINQKYICLIIVLACVVDEAEVSN